MKKPRGILIAGNWKMNQGPRETEQFFSQLKQMIRPDLFQKDLLKACVIPPAVSLEKAKKEAPSYVQIGAQNAHWEKKGAFTGELSGPLLQELGISWVLAGHSERRQYFGETDSTVRKRAESLLGQGFRVILCIGETRSERESGKTEEVLDRQLSETVPNLNSYLDGRVILAYEPVWAIGTGLTATPEQAEQVHHWIRNFLHQKTGLKTAEQTPVLYGGSVTPENIDSLLKCPNVDGALVGGASLKAESFYALLEAGYKAIG